jgi:hypothetical protein
MICDHNTISLSNFLWAFVTSPIVHGCIGALFVFWSQAHLARVQLASKFKLELYERFSERVYAYESRNAEIVTSFDMFRADLSALLVAGEHYDIIWEHSVTTEEIRQAITDTYTSTEPLLDLIYRYSTVLLEPDVHQERIVRFRKEAFQVYRDNLRPFANSLLPYKENDDGEPRSRITQEIFDQMIPSFDELKTVLDQLHSSIHLTNFEFQNELVNKTFFPKGLKKFFKTVIG